MSLQAKLDALRLQRLQQLEIRIKSTQDRMHMFPAAAATFERHLEFLQNAFDLVVSRVGSDVAHIDELQELADMRKSRAV